MTWPRISVVIPAWRAAAFIAETLGSLRDQEFSDFQAIISVDGEDEETASACRYALGDSRFKLVVQTERLGWLANTNAGLAHVNTELAAILPHDDLIAPSYLQWLIGVLDQDRDAACAYSDIEAFGTMSGVHVQRSVRGSPLTRQMKLLRDHFGAVAFRAVFRSEILGQFGSLAAMGDENFACDTLWMNRLARAGDLRRVPAVLYRKRYHQDNTHTQWAAWSEERKVAAWFGHCAASLAEALRIDADERGRSLLYSSALDRLLQRESNAEPYWLIRSLSQAERNSLSGRFAALHPELHAKADPRNPLPVFGLRCAQNWFPRKVE